MAQNDGSIQIVGELDLDKVEKSVDSLEKKIRDAAVSMGVSIEGLTEKLRTDFDAMNKTIRKAGNDAARAAKAMTDDMDMDDNLESYNKVVSSLKELQKAFLNGEVSVDSYEKQYKDLREELQKVAYQANLVGNALPKATPLSLGQARKVEAGGISTQEIQGYNIPQLQQALAIMDNVIKRDGVSLENQQKMVDLRGEINERLKDSLKTTKQLSDEEAKRVKKAADEAVKVQSGAMQKVALQDLPQKNLVEMTTKVKAYKAALEKLNDPLGDNAKQAAEFRKQINKLNGQMSRVYGTTQKTNGAMSRLSNGFKNLMTRMAFYVSVGALVGFAKQIIQVRGEFEKTTVALGSIIKDFDKANQLFLQVQQTALKSPFSIMELTKSTKQLAAYNVGVEDLHDTMKMLADLSAGVGTEMQRLVVNYGQIKALGVANNRELKDFAVAGLPVYEELANRFTVLEGRMVSAGEVFERVSNRMVSFQDVQAILENLTEEGGRFYNIQEEMSKTMAGRLSNLTDAYQVMYNEIGQRGQGVIIGFINLFKGLAENWEKLIPLAHALGIAIAGWGINKAVINMKALGVAATIAAQKILHLKTTMQASTTINPWVVLATVVLSVAAAIYGAVKEANRFNKELDKIKTDGDAKIEELTLRFKILADTIKNAGDGTTEQREAYEELQRTFGDILPSQTLEIENLKNQTDGYKALTEAIRDNIKSKTLEKSLSAIKAEYADDINNQASRLKEALSEGQGFYSGAEKLTELQASRVVSAVSESIRNGSIDLQNYNYELRNIIKEQTGLSVSILNYNNNTIFSLYEMIRKTTEMNDKLKETEQIYNLSDTSLGYLNDRWDNIKNSADKYRQEQNEILANTKTLGKLETTELEFKLKTDKEELGKYVVGVNEIIQDELNKQTNKGKDIKLKITADTDVFSKDFKAELSKLDSTSQTLVGNLLKRFSAIRGKLIPTDEFEISRRSLEKVLGTINNAQINLDDLARFMKTDTESFIDYIGRIHSNLKSQEEIVNGLNVKLANSKDPSKEKQDIISQELLKENQKLQVLKEMAELYPQLKAKKDTTDAYSKQVSLIKELVTEFRKLAVANQDLETAATDVESAYNDVFSELFKGEEFDMAKLLTFSDKDVVSAIKTLQSQFAEGSKQYLSLGKLVAEYELKISASIEEQKLNEAEQELQKLFDTYKVNVEIGTMGEYGDLMAKIFDVDKIDLDGLESKINEVLSQFDSNYTKTIATLESEAAAETDPNKKQNLENEIANMKAANAARTKLEQDAQSKIESLRADEYKKSANRYIKMINDYATYEEKILKIKLEASQKRSDIQAQLDKKHISDEEASRLNDLVNREETEKVASVEMGELKGSEIWQMAFEDMDRIATDSLNHIIKKMEEFKKSQGESLSPSEFKELSNTISNLRKELEDRVPFSAFSKELKAIQEEADAIDLQPLMDAMNADAEALDAAKSNEESMQENGGEQDQAVATMQRVAAQEKLNQSTAAYLKALNKKQVAEKKSQTAFKKTISNVDRLGKGFVDVTNGALDLAEALGVEVGDSAKSAVNVLSTLVTSSVSVMTAISTASIASSLAITATSTTAASAIKAVETASVILAIIGAALQIAQALANMISSMVTTEDEEIQESIEVSKKRIESLEKENRKLEHTYNQLKRAIDKSLGSAEIAARKAAIAQQELIKQNLILRKQEIEKQIALQKSRDLKEGGKKDKERDEAVDALKDELQKVNEEIDNLTNDIEDAVDDIANTLLGSNLKSAAEDLASSFLDAWRSGEDPFTVIDEQFQDMIDNMIVKAIAGQVVAAKLKKIFDMVQAATEGDDKIDEDEIKDIAEAGKGVSKEIGEELKALMEALGIGFGSGAASSLSELQKGIQGMSEEQGGALESLWTTSVANSFTIINIISNSLAVQNAQLNELRSGNQVRAAIYALLQSTTSEDGLALRVDLRN